MRGSSLRVGSAVTLSLLSAVASISCGGGGGGGGGFIPAPSPSISAKPFIVADQSAAQGLSFAAVQGISAPSSQSITFTNVGGGTMSWTVSSTAGWLKLSPTSGASNSALVTATVDSSGLVAGSYAASITFSDPNAVNPSKVISVFFTVQPAPAIPPVAPFVTAPTRPDIFTGASLPPVSLQDRLLHLHSFPGIAGTTYLITLDTTPTSSNILIRIEQPGRQVFVDTTTVKTPFTTSITAQQDETVLISVYDPAQINLTLSKVQVMPTKQPYNPTSFRVVVHFLGDSFAGFGKFNDLASSSDRSSFAFDLVSRVNTIFAPMGIQIDSTIGYDSYSSGQVASVNPSLVWGGFTILPLSSDSQVASLGSLGVNASDPAFGKALDIFIVQTSQNTQASGFTVGFAPAFLGTGSLGGLGGVFSGFGARNSAFFELFYVDPSTNVLKPLSMDLIATTAAHEIAHFLSLNHTSESNYHYNGHFPDAPFTPFANDVNKNFFMEPTEFGADTSNLMFWENPGTTLTSGQINGIKGFLAIRDH